jgi:pimeloyl-ACP methyl ester carboxylesterase
MSWEMAAFTFSMRAPAPPGAPQPAPPQPADVARRLPGSEWATQPQLSWQLPGPPRPAAAAADLLVAAGAEGPAARFAALRGATLPAEALSTPAPAPAPAAAAASSAAPPLAAPAAAAAAPRRWEWGLPLAGANLWDPSVGELILKGLAYEGSASASGPELSGGAAQALLTCHYSLHGAFLLDAPLLAREALAPLRARRTPCIAVQGGADIVCPPAAAYELAEAWPEAEVAIVAGAGHSMYDPLIAHELVTATDRLRGAAR